MARFRDQLMGNQHREEPQQGGDKDMRRSERQRKRSSPVGLKGAGRKVVWNSDKEREAGQEEPEREEPDADAQELLWSHMFQGWSGLA
jgi:hypothetical protein